MSGQAWIRRYDEGVPPTLHPYPDKTLVDVIRETAAERPHHPALRFMGRTVTPAILRPILRSSLSNAATTCRP